MDPSDSELDPVVEVNDNDLPNDDEHGEDESMEEEDESEVDKEAEEDVLDKPVRKVKKPSPVWKCADRADGGARCKFCKRVFKTKDGNTKSIIRHVTEKHSTKPDVKLMKLEMTKNKENLNQKKKVKAAKSLQPKINFFSKKRGILDPMKKKKIEEDLVKMTIMMNKPFSDVENPFFRKLLHTAEPNFICPGRTTHTAQFDIAAAKVKADLKKEIVKDVTTAGHKTITVTSDHGTHSDRFHTKENAVTLSRTTENFVIKKDIIQMLKCEESQTGKQIRTEVKEALIKGAGYEEDWIVNWVTDGEAKQLNATDPTKHPELGMKICHRNKCVDHTLELGSEDTVKQCVEMKTSLQKERDFVNYMKDSYLARAAFHKMMIDAGVEPLAIIQGTTNRWFHKYSEARRALELKDSINQFFDEYETPENLSSFTEGDWHMLLVYENAMRSVVDASKVLEGELYPTASSVIPFLDAVRLDLEEMSTKEKSEAGRRFIVTLLKNLQSPNRFPDGYKNETPFNSLTLLDPRYTNMYFNENQTKKAFNDIYIDMIYDDMKDEAPASPPPAPTLQAEAATDRFSVRWAELVAKKSAGSVQTVTAVRSVRGKLKAELDRFLSRRETLDRKENPMDWWRLNHMAFPLLAHYWKAHSSFPATSTSAERAYSMDGLIMTSCR